MTADTAPDSAPLVEVAVDESAWIEEPSASWRDDETAFVDFIDRAARAALVGIQIPHDRVHISALFCGDARMRALNGSFRGRDKATNVLSWPAFSLSSPLTGDAVAELVQTAADPDGRVFMGDLALGFETVYAEAAAAEKTLEDHTAHLIVHGVLHLFGFSHEMDEDAAAMEQRETEALASLGVADPHTEGSVA